MKLDERLNEHFAEISPGLTGPPGRVESVVSAGQGRGPLGRLILGAGVIGIAVAALALLAALTDPFNGVASNQNDEPARVVVSPYLTTQSRMMVHDDQVLFTVTTDAPSYWRLASLDTYEDHIWKLNSSFDPGLPALDSGTAPEDDAVTIRQEFEVLTLGEIWLPAAPEPATAAADVDGVIIADPTSRTLSVSNDRQDSDGLRYSVVSHAAVASPDKLRAAPPIDEASMRPQYLSTFNFPAATAELAGELTAGIDTDYDRLIAVRDHLSSFELDNAPPPSDADVDPTERFLDARRGSAMDFASTFTMVARELGIPSRLAVGFTAGQAVEPDPVSTRGDSQILPAAELTTFEVSNRHAHAWPEVYFEGIGWIAFESTPDQSD